MNKDKNVCKGILQYLLVFMHKHYWKAVAHSVGVNCMTGNEHVMASDGLR